MARALAAGRVRWLATAAGLDRMRGLLAALPERMPLSIADIEVDDQGEPVNDRGIRQALRVRRKPCDAGDFEIVAGERRFWAATFAGLRRITCEIVSLSDEGVAEEQLVEAISLDDLERERNLAAAEALLTGAA